MKPIYKLLLVLFIFPNIIFGTNDSEKQEKSKTLKKEYTVNSNATVDINNKYGNVTVATWNKNRVEITVKITVKGNNASALDKKLASIDVDFFGDANLVKAKTVFEKSNSWNFWGNSNNVSYQIDYTIKMPISNNVKLANDYGSILLDEIDGESVINCDYGKIIIGRLNNKSNSINLDYCSKSTINYINNGDINIDYSKLNVDDAVDLNVNSDYSTLHFEKVNGINFNADYGSISVGNANNIVGNSDYVSIRIGTIYKNLKLDTDYGSIKIEELAQNFNNAYINAEYTGISIGTRSTNNFSFSIDLSYASFRYDDDNVELFKSIEKSTKKYYEGVYGKSKSSSKITIKSQYGSVNLKEL